jgi:hypothetical protein
MTTPFRKPRRCNAAGSSVMVNPPVFLALQARGLKFLFQCKKRLLHRQDIIQIARSGAYAWRIRSSSKPGANKARLLLALNGVGRVRRARAVIPL